MNINLAHIRIWTGLIDRFPLSQKRGLSARIVNWCPIPVFSTRPKWRIPRKNLDDFGAFCAQRQYRARTKVSRSIAQK